MWLISLSLKEIMSTNFNLADDFIAEQILKKLLILRRLQYLQKDCAQNVK